MWIHAMQTLDSIKDEAGIHENLITALNRRKLFCVKNACCKRLQTLKADAWGFVVNPKVGLAVLEKSARVGQILLI